MMKKLFGLLIGVLVLSGMALGYSTHTTWETGAVTTGTVVTVSFPQVVNSFTVVNLGTEELYIAPRGDLAIGRITNEAVIIGSNEATWSRNKVSFNDFRTKKVNLLAKTANGTYRIWATY